MSNANPTKPRTLSHAASMRIINSARTDWQTWFAACLIPVMVYVALAFLWAIKLKMDLPEDDSPDWVIKSNGLSDVSQLVAHGYYYCVVILCGGGLVQFCIRRNRAATAAIVFALVALIIGVCLNNFAASIDRHNLEILMRPTVKNSPY